MMLRQSLCACWLAILGVLANTSARADASVQVRVVQDMHDARVQQVRSDPTGQRLATISSDKTLRISRLADLNMLRSIPLPALDGPEGTPYALSWSADGSEVFVGGYSGTQRLGAAQVWAVDPATGRVTRALGSFVGKVIQAIDRSPDGTRLAVGLGSGGLAVLNVETGDVVWSDEAYAGSISFVHFAPDGRLATAAHDGCLRVYGVDGAVLYRRQHTREQAALQCVGGGMGGVRFSPDGKWLAFGTTDRSVEGRDQPEAVLLDAQSLQRVRVIHIDRPGQRNLCCIAWSPDGSTLWLNGSDESGRAASLYRISNLPYGEPVPLEVGQQSFTNMLPLPDGDLVFSTTVPSLTRLRGVMQARSTSDVVKVAESLPSSIDFFRTRLRQDAFLVSEDGHSVSFEMAPGRWLRADPLSADLAGVLGETGTRDPDMQPALRLRNGLDLKIASLSPTEPMREPPRVNGQPLQMLATEVTTSHAVHPSQSWVAVGTQFRLLLVDARGVPVAGWEQAPYVGNPIYHVAFSRDGRWLVVALADGSIRWFDVTSAQQRLGLFVHANGADWVVWRPDGYYASSPRGDRFLGWLIDRGPTQSPDLRMADQFERQLFRPERVRAALEMRQGAGSQQEGRPLDLQSLEAPRVRIERLDAEKRVVEFSIERGRGPRIEEVGIYANGLPVLTSAQRREVATSDAVRYSIQVPAGLPFDRVRVEAETATSVGRDEAASTVVRPPASSRSANLWVLSVGVDDFYEFAACRQAGNCPALLSALPHAGRDASALAKQLAQASSGGLFARAHQKVLAPGSTDGSPNREAILRGLAWLEQASPEDTVVIFLGSHGLADDRAGEYYFVPADGRPDDVARVALGGGTPAIRNVPPKTSLLSASDVTLALRRVAGRRVLVLDTCHAGAAAGRNSPYSLAKRSAAAQVAVLASSRGRELAYEHSDPGIRHGAFTEALVRGLAGRAGQRQARGVTLHELHAFVLPEVSANVRRLAERQRAGADVSIRVTQTPELIAAEEAASTVLPKALAN